MQDHPSKQEDSFEGFGKRRKAMLILTQSRVQTAAIRPKRNVLCFNYSLRLINVNISIAIVIVAHRPWLRRHG